MTFEILVFKLAKFGLAGVYCRGVILEKIAGDANLAASVPIIDLLFAKIDCLLYRSVFWLHF